MKKQFKIYHDTNTVTYDETQEKKDLVWNEIIRWCQEHDATSGESCQNDDFQIDAPQLIANILDDIIEFKVDWDIEEDENLPF